MYGEVRNRLIHAETYPNFARNALKPTISNHNYILYMIASESQPLIRRSNDSGIAYKREPSSVYAKLACATCIMAGALLIGLICVLVQIHQVNSTIIDRDFAIRNGSDYINSLKEIHENDMLSLVIEQNAVDQLQLESELLRNLFLSQKNFSFDTCDAAFGRIIRGEQSADSSNIDVLGVQCLETSQLSSPYGVAINDSVMYVTEQGGAVAVLNRLTGKLERRFGENLQKKQFSSIAVFGDIVYVGSLDGNCVYVFNGLAGTLMRNITLKSKARVYGVAVVEQDRLLYLTDESNGEISQYSIPSESDGVEVLQKQWKLESPEEIVHIPSSGELFVLQDRQKVYTFTNDSDVISEWLNLTTKGQPQTVPFQFGTLAVSSEKKLYMSVWISGDIYEYNLVSQDFDRVIVTGVVGGVFGLDVDAQGKIVYATSFSNGQVNAFF